MYVTVCRYVCMKASVCVFMCMNMCVCVCVCVAGKGRLMYLSVCEWMGVCVCGYIMFRAQVCVYECIYLMCSCGYMCLFLFSLDARFRSLRRPAVLKFQDT